MPDGSGIIKPWAWLDKKAGQSPFQKSAKHEKEYARKLRHVAREVGRIVNGFPAGDTSAASALNVALSRYSELLRPWAQSVVGRLLVDLDRQDEQAWLSRTKAMGRAIRYELETAPTGQALRGYLDENVRLITSLPLEAGQRVHELTMEALSNSTRASEIAKEIQRTGDVTESRATLIARTEVSRTQTGLTEVRAKHIGCTGYHWDTAEDGDVRPSHKAMQGKLVTWDAPPTLDGMTGHAGSFPNCRCRPIPVLPETF